MCLVGKATCILRGTFTCLILLLQFPHIVLIKKGWDFYGYASNIDSVRSTFIAFRAEVDWAWTQGRSVPSTAGSVEQASKCLQCFMAIKDLFILIAFDVLSSPTVCWGIKAHYLHSTLAFVKTNRCISWQHKKSESAKEFLLRSYATLALFRSSIVAAFLRLNNLVVFA